MSKLTPEIPFTELVERVVQLARTEADPSRARGAINDVYVRELPIKEDWTFLLVSSAITCTDDFNTGTCSVNTQASAVTFSTDVVLDASFTGRRIKFSGNANVYDFTFSNTTGGTVNPPLSGTSNITNGSYVIYQSVYALSDDYDRWPKNGGLQVFQGGQITPIKEVSPQEWYREHVATTNIPERCRLVRAGTDMIQRFELNPPPNQPYVLGNEYLVKLDPLRESTAGFVSISASGTSVTGSAGTTRFTEAQTGWYIRIDAFGTGEDSEWYRVSAITHNSSLTLATAFGLSGATTAQYTLSAVPMVPSKLHPALLYGAVRQLTTDQNDPNHEFYQAKFTEAIVDAKRVYKSRDYNTDVQTVFEEYHYRR